jgi:hypothetical protein
MEREATWTDGYVRDLKDQENHGLFDCKARRYLVDVGGE